jgi:hypothetical protein
MEKKMIIIFSITLLLFIVLSDCSEEKPLKTVKDYKNIL